jgi:hypothetical protein
VPRVTYEHTAQVVKRQAGKTLKTPAGRREFKVDVVDGVMYATPLSSGKRRRMRASDQTCGAALQSCTRTSRTCGAALQSCTRTSPLPAPCSLLSAPRSLLPAPRSLLPASRSLLPGTLDP